MNLSINPNIYFGFPHNPQFGLGDLVTARMGESILFCTIQGISWPSTIGEEKAKEWQYSLEIHAYLADGSISLNEEFGSIVRCEFSLEKASEEIQEVILQAENSLWNIGNSVAAEMKELV